MDIIRKYYNDNIPEIQRQTVNSEAYQAVTRQIEELEKIISANMTDEERERLEDYSAAIMSRESVMEEELFTAAFRLGARLTFDIITKAY